MKLIGAGLPRTGTLSQKVALEMLGLAPCYHMVNVLANLDEVQVWRRALEGDSPWDEVFDGYPSTVDWPGSYHYRELIDVYPDAKVLLSVRDADAWERSMRDTIWGLLYGDTLISKLSDVRAELDPKWQQFTDLMKDMWRTSGLIDDGSETTSESMKQAMESFNEEVQRTVPPERLLVWSPADGWEPLCEFLEIPVPDTPFPHLNDSKQFGERIVDASLLTLQEWRAKDAPPVAAT
jgi:hypothetical protein